MVGANVHKKVKVSSQCLLNSGTICFDIPKWSGVIGGLTNLESARWFQTHTSMYIYVSMYLYIYVFHTIIEYLKL